LAVVMALTLGTSADAHDGPHWTRSKIVSDGAWPYQRWVNRALVPSVAGPVIVSADLTPCEGAKACALNREIHLWPHSGAYIQRTIFEHEEGHLFDEERMTDEARAEFEAILGLTEEEWRPERKVTDSEGGPPFELFAQAYALCALVANRDEVVEWENAYGYWPTRPQHKAICRLIRSV
jgi:hypothetical protein